MQTNELVRDARRVYGALETSGETLVAREDLWIYIPVRFAEKDLAFVGSETFIVGIFMIRTADMKYAVSLIDAMIQIDPTNTTIVKMDDVAYYEFYFRPGATVITNLNLVKNNKLIYSIFNEIYTKGKAPWYLNYLDFAHALNSSKKHAGVNIGNHEVMELLASMLARDATNKNRFYRQVVKTAEDIARIQPAIIPLRSVQYAATNTTNKLAGSYFRPALVSALTNPATEVERVENILKQ